jgi:glycerol-3-phosphate cytidylyltransferase-like family protein
MEEQVIVLSGAADPLTVGHLKLIQDAAKYGRVVWVLNSDHWLRSKKGYAFMKWADRAEILRSIKGISEVLPVDDSDGSVCKALEVLKPTYFGHGGKEYAIPELKTCADLGIELVWGLGGEVQFSSGDIIDCMINNLIDRIEPHFKK